MSMKIERMTLKDDVSKRIREATRHEIVDCEKALRVFERGKRLLAEIHREVEGER